MQILYNRYINNNKWVFAQILEEWEEYALSKKEKAASAAVAASSGKEESKGVVGYFKRELSKFSKGKFLLILMIPGIVYFALFHYWPFYGLLAAFKDYKPKLGILGSPWADTYGLAEFIRFFTIPDVWSYVWNTIVLSILHIIWLFPLAIILALFINELRSAKFKKIVQTISYLPHFVSVAAICGMLTLFRHHSKHLLMPEVTQTRVLLTRFF